jgi:hypothetical protein
MMGIPVTVSLDDAANAELQQLIAVGQSLQGFKLELGPQTLTAVNGLVAALNKIGADIGTAEAAAPQIASSLTGLVQEAVGVTHK